MVGLGEWFVGIVGRRGRCVVNGMESRYRPIVFLVGSGLKVAEELTDGELVGKAVALRQRSGPVAEAMMDALDAEAVRRGLC